MDTSARTDTLYYLMGWEKRLASEIPAETWLKVIHRICLDSQRRTNDLIAVPKLFIRIGDMLENRDYAPREVPRGLTVFSEGIGVNTVVQICKTHSVYGGEPLVPHAKQLWTHTADDFLLLILTKGRSLVQWATWTLEYQMARAQPPENELGFITTITSSKVAWLARWDGEHIDETPVVEVFRKYPDVPLILLGNFSHFCEREIRGLRETASDLEALSKTVSGIMSRVGH
jgi:hypothetical protein